MSKREYINSSGKCYFSKVKEKPKLNYEDTEQFELDRLAVSNYFNGTNYTSYQQIPRAVIQVPIDLVSNDGIQVGKLINQAIYYIANFDFKSARKCLQKTKLYNRQTAKNWIKSERAVQARNPEEALKYLNKEMPNDFKITIN